MSESERFHRYGGISKGKRSDSEIPAVDDGDPVLRPKPCSKPRWSDPTFLVLGFVAFIVVGYMSMFYTTHELGQSYSQYRKEEAKHVETVEDLHAVSFGERDYDQDVIAGLGSSGPNEPADYGVTTSNKALGISESREVRPQTPDGKKEEVLLTGARESGSIDGVPKESRGGEKPAEKTVHAPEESLKYSGSINQPGMIYYSRLCSHARGQTNVSTDAGCDVFAVQLLVDALIETYGIETTAVASIYVQGLAVWSSILR